MERDYEVFELGDVVLREGVTLRETKLAYKTYGTLNEAKMNAIVYPTGYSGRYWESEWLIGEGMALDPREYFVNVPYMLGNGVSSSPSNTPPPGSYAESLDESATFKQLRESPPAPPVPTVVLTADRPQLTKEALAKGQLSAGVDQEFADAL